MIASQKFLKTRKSVAVERIVLIKPAETTFFPRFGFYVPACASSSGFLAFHHVHTCEFSDSLIIHMLCLAWNPEIKKEPERLGS